MSSRETVLYLIETGPDGVEALANDPEQVKQKELVNWRDLPTNDITADGVHYLESRLYRLTDMTLAPCARLRQDKTNIGRNGGQLVCLADPRISLYAPESALRVEIPFIVQVQQFDPHQVHAIKEHHKSFMSEFMCCSPLLYLTCAKKLLFQPMTLNLPVTTTTVEPTVGVPTDMLRKISYDRPAESDEPAPTTGTKTPNTTYYDNFQKSLILPQLLAGNRTEASEMVLMVKSEKSGDKWAVWREAIFVGTDGEINTYQFERVENCRILLLKMRKLPEAEILCRCATVLEQSLSQHIVYFALRQHVKQPHQIYLLLSSDEQLESSLQSMADEGFKDGDKPQGPAFLTDGQQLDITFRSNIRMTDISPHIADRKKSGKVLKLSFTSAVANRHKITLEPIDKTSQVGLDHYRGFVDIHCMKEILKDTANENTGGKFVRGGKTRFKVFTERILLARIVVKLPKAPEVANELRTVRSFEFEAKDVVTRRYLKDLGSKLPNDHWRRLGTALGLSRCRLEAICGKCGSEKDSLGYAMLISWVKTLPIAADRFSILYRALQAIGRTDLATELCVLSGDYVDNDDTD